MQALVRRRYGGPEVFSVQNVEAPAVGPGDVLVQVHAAAVNALDWRLMRASPAVVRLGYGLRRPKHRILGADAAGTVVGAGSDVTRLRLGQAVYGDVSGTGFGAFAQLVAAPADVWADKPENVGYDEAAAVPVAGVTALKAITDQAEAGPGTRVLVNGASGGVGSFAVQIAKAVGAEVTGVCRTQSVDFVRDLGADHMIDFTNEDYTKHGGPYDVVIDCAAHRPLRECRDALSDNGHYVMVGGSFGPMLRTFAFGRLIARPGQRMTAISGKPKRSDLERLTQMIQAGMIRPAIDRRYPLSDAAEAVRHVEDGPVRGKTVVLMDPVPHQPRGTGEAG